MKNYKICVYVNPHGDKYYTVSRRLFWVFWETLKTYESYGLDYRNVIKKFDSYEDALKYIAQLARRNYKRVNCELV